MSLVQLALNRPYTFIVMAILIVLGTPFALKNMATDPRFHRLISSIAMWPRL